MSDETTTYKFVMGNEGDRSVGIDAYHEEVAISFEYGATLEPEDIDFFKKYFAELADGWCVTKGEWDEERERDRAHDAAEHERWKKDHPEDLT